MLEMYVNGEGRVKNTPESIAIIYLHILDIKRNFKRGPQLIFLTLVKNHISTSKRLGSYFRNIRTS